MTLQMVATLFSPILTQFLPKQYVFKIEMIKCTRSLPVKFYGMSNQF